MKNWNLSFSTFEGGKNYYFYTASGALKYLKNSIWEKCFVDLTNKKLGIEIRLHVPDEKYQYSLGYKMSDINKN